MAAVRPRRLRPRTPDEFSAEPATGWVDPFQPPEEQLRRDGEFGRTCSEYFAARGWPKHPAICFRPRNARSRQATKLPELISSTAKENAQADAVRTLRYLACRRATPAARFRGTTGSRSMKPSIRAPSTLPPAKRRKREPARTFTYSKPARSRSGVLRKCSSARRIAVVHFAVSGWRPPLKRLERNQERRSTADFVSETGGLPAVAANESE